MNKLIISALAKLNIPIAFLEYSGKADKYIVFSITKEKETDIFDNENNTITYYVTLNYWYKNPNDYSYVNQIKTALKDGGFIYDDARDLKDGDFFGKNYDFIYIEYL